MLHRRIWPRTLQNRIRILRPFFGFGRRAYCPQLRTAPGPSKRRGKNGPKGPKMAKMVTWFGAQILEIHHWFGQNPGSQKWHFGPFWARFWTLFWDPFFRGCRGDISSIRGYGPPPAIGAKKGSQKGPILDPFWAPFWTPFWGPFSGPAQSTRAPFGDTGLLQPQGQNRVPKLVPKMDPFFGPFFGYVHLGQSLVSSQLGYGPGPQKGPK